MLIVGELINTSRKLIRAAVESRDREYIQEIAEKQVRAGADYLDVNCGTLLDGETVAMKWLVEIIQEVVQAPLCIDSPNPLAIEAGLASCHNGQSMVNSISGEKERFENILPLVLKYQTKVIALCMDDTGMPETAADRLRVADKLVKDLTSAGVSCSDIYFDPLIKPIGTSDKAGLQVLETIQMINERYPDVHFICGLSNVSHGLPHRKVLNQVFMIQTMVKGMDAYILDPLDNIMMGFVLASKLLLGQDEYCLRYIKASRNGLYG